MLVMSRLYTSCRFKGGLCWNSGGLFTSPSADFAYLEQVGLVDVAVVSGGPLSADELVEVFARIVGQVHRREQLPIEVEAGEVVTGRRSDAWRLGSGRQKHVDDDAE